MKISTRSRGMSLLVVLAFIVIITVLVVGFAESMRLLRPTAASHLERARADQFAWAGVERVIAALRLQTADTNRNWISQPGQLVAGALTNDPSTPRDERQVLTNIIPLHSGLGAAGTNPLYAPPNLNLPTFRDPATYLISDTAVPMNVRWIYVRQSGNIDTNAVPATLADDPLVGRFAYWTDDESSKVNYNIAWGRAGNTNAPGHPSRVELTALPGLTQVHADTLRRFITNVASTNTPFNFFNTPLDARRIELVPGGAGVASALASNRFDVTHFNSDPNTTFFNEQRIVLTTRPDRAGWSNIGGTNWVGVNGLGGSNGVPRYIRILNTAPTINNPAAIYTNTDLDPGRSGNLNISPTAVSETLRTLVEYLKRSDWPMVDYSGTMPANGGSLQNKFYNRYDPSIRENRLYEIAINIIEYVRAKESPQRIVQPLRGGLDTVSMTYNLNNNTNNQYIGISRTPFITELGLWYGSAPTNFPTWPSPANQPTLNDNARLQTPVSSGDWMFRLILEVHLPKSYGVSSLDLASPSQPVYVYTSLPAAVNDQIRNAELATPPAPDVRRVNTLAGSGIVWRLQPEHITIFSTNGTPRADTVLSPGEYAVLKLPALYQRKSFADLPANPTNAPAGKMNPPNPVRLRVTIGAGPGGANNWNIVPNTLMTNVPLSIDLTGATAENAVRSIEVDDPRVNMSPLDWAANASGENTFGRTSSRTTLGTAPSGLGPNEAQQDTDASGRITDASFVMPPPAGMTFTNSDGIVFDNTSGMVTSAGELGFIHTGVEPGSTVTTSSGAVVAVNVGGIPWRSLRLQPSSASTKVVPDWALMDIFTAPIAPPTLQNRFVYAPNNTAFGGRVNLNAKAEPLAGTEPFGGARISPVAAVFLNNRFSANSTNTISALRSRELATNVFGGILAASGKQYGRQDAYDSPGEVVEIRGIADGGETSEELVRQIMNLFTTRGNVFTVYSIGQALQQSPGGKITVTADQRMQATIERTTDFDGRVRFVPVYLRSLSP